MKTISKVIFFFITLSVLSCSGDDSSAPDTDNPTAPGFAWTENGGSVVFTSSDAAFSEQYKTFMVKDADDVLQFEINLTATTEGTYDVSSGNVFTYTKVNPFFVASAGVVIITSKANGKVSGTFDVTGSGSGITSLKGSFTDVDIVQ